MLLKEFTPLFLHRGFKAFLCGRPDFQSESCTSSYGFRYIALDGVHGGIDK